MLLGLASPAARLLCSGMSGNTPMEHKLETEIDPALPRRSFTNNDREFLEVRPKGFDSRGIYTKEGKLVGVEKFPNWEWYASAYWWEKHTLYSGCPMEPTGISTHADWALLVPCMFGDSSVLPRVIFVHTLMLPHFIESTLKFLSANASFVLLSGGVDLTIPRSALDSRYQPLRGFSKSRDGGAYFQRLVKDPRLIHWYCENHDLQNPKLSTLPTGFAPNEGFRDPMAWAPQDYTLLENRNLQFLVSEKEQEGQQWAERARVAQLCASMGQRGWDYCIFNNASAVSHEAFVALLSSVPLMACVHGGGVDPSPMAWEAILLGSIPIVQRLTVGDLYAHLPVAFIDDWDELLDPPDEASLQALLQGWVRELGPYSVPGSELRRKTIDRLKTAYWMEQQRFTPADTYSFMHISKCAGSYWIRDLNKIFFRVGGNFYPETEAGQEHCFYWQKNFAHGEFLVSLKSPRKHLWSLYTECRYDNWGADATRYTAFPKTSSNEDAFGKWVEHFLAGGKTTNAFNCYHPANYQSRQLTYDQKDIINVLSVDGVVEYEPRLDAVMQVYDQFSWVALADFTHESKCLLYSRMVGFSGAKRREIDTFLESCRCAVALTQEKAVQHHTGGHRSEMATLDPHTLALVDSLTKVDQQLFQTALRDFLRNVAAAEEQLGRRFLCDEVLRGSESELLYVMENVTEAYLQAKADFSSLEPQNSTLIALQEQMADLQRQVDELQGQGQERRLLLVPAPVSAAAQGPAENGDS
ncbi:hypothetical protein B484DRAFT_399583 [Ochromonadaceae sp. CCMP2298]|nr:hypothetical protein B484DRAFT_399583 [Ochromonadaceae sp. CCMP2298]